jgi:hypothetical protein
LLPRNPGVSLARNPGVSLSPTLRVGGFAQRPGYHISSLRDDGSSRKSGAQSGDIASRNPGVSLSPTLRFGGLLNALVATRCRNMSPLDNIRLCSNDTRKTAIAKVACGNFAHFQ